MSHHTWVKWVGRRLGLVGRRAAKLRRAASARPRVEALEDRLAPAIHIWTGNVSSSWSNALNWDGGSPAGDPNAVLIFPSAATRFTSTNNFSSIPIQEIQIFGTGYTIDSRPAGSRIVLGASGIKASNASGTNTIAAGITLSGAGRPIDVTDGDATLNLSGVLDGPGGVSKGGAGQLTFSGAAANTYTGTTTVNDGVLALNKTPTFGAMAGPLVIGDGVDTDEVRIIRSNQVGGSVTVNRSGLFNFINNSSSSLQAPLFLDGGEVRTGSGLVAVEEVTVTGGGTPSLISGSLVGFVGGEVNFNVQEGADLLVTAAIGDYAGTVVKNGPGRLQLTGNNINTGATTVNAGTLRITNATALGFSPVFGSAHTEVKNGATLEVFGAFTLQEDLILAGTVHTLGAGLSFARLSRPVTLTGDATLRTDTDAVVAGPVRGDFNLTKTGAADLTLASANPNYGGLTTVQQGVLQIDNALGLGSAAAADGTVVEAGASLVVDSFGRINEPLTLDGAGAPDGGGALFVRDLGVEFAGPITLAGNTVVGSDIPETPDSPLDTVTLSNRVTGPGGLTIALDSTVTFAGSVANDYAGGTTVNGALRLNKQAAVNAIPATGTLSITTVGTTLGSVVVRSNDQIPDDVPIVIDDGILGLDGSETVGPLTLIGDGRVLGQSISTLTLGGDVVVINGDDRAQISGIVSLGNATRTFTVVSGQLSLNANGNGTLSGAGGLIKDGAGFMSLEGANSYTGPTTVNGGILFVRGDLPSPVTVNSGGRLSGNGADPRFAGAFTDITVSGGILDPGDDPNGPLAPPVNEEPTVAGIMNATGAVALDSGSTFLFDIEGTTPGAANGDGGHDQLRITGNGSLDLGNARLELNFLGFQPQTGQTFVLVQNDTPNPNSGQFSHPERPGQPIRQFEPFVLGGRTFLIDYEGGSARNDIVLFVLNTPPMVRDLELTPPEASVGESVVLTGSLIDPDAADELTLLVD
jgi:autotransporter-associated beta strand protein